MSSKCHKTQWFSPMYPVICITRNTWKHNKTNCKPASLFAIRLSLGGGSFEVWDISTMTLDGSQSGESRNIHFKALGIVQLGNQTHISYSRDSRSPKELLTNRWVVVALGHMFQRSKSFGDVMFGKSFAINSFRGASHFNLFHLTQDGQVLQRSNSTVDNLGIL